ncbi:MAG: nicotinamide riboside transporter PnuC [Sediminibacterium sp.]|jgi:nicotinamide mononucleotide transporter
MSSLFESIYHGLLQTSWLELIAVIAGISSVWYSRKESVLVYPVGLVNTTIYIYLSYKGHLLGEASVNLYYTIMSIWGWYLWTRIDPNKKSILLKITKSNKKDWMSQILFFLFFYFTLYFSLMYLKKEFAPEAIPWADALASASAYTGMWLMAKKKVESWIWWIITNIASIPLYFIKGYTFTSVQFIVLLVIAIAGLKSWNDKARNNIQNRTH